MDKRIQRTRKLLGNALVDLLNERSFHQITIRQITERAAVAYSTFFRNFESTEDLLLAHLLELLQDLKRHTQSVDGTTLRERQQSKVKMIFRHVQENQQKYRVLLTTSAVQPTLNAFQQDMIQNNLIMFESYRGQIKNSTPPLELVVHTNVMQLFSMIEWWLDNNLYADAETFADHYEQLTLIPTWDLLFGEDLAHKLLNAPQC